MLTNVQMETLDFIRGHLEQSGGVAPTVREIAHGMGYANHGCVQLTLTRLQDRGYIRRMRGRARAMEVIQRVAYFKFDEDAKELKMINPG
jgi:SOS-response transcriptional repressor LexA